MKPGKKMLKGKIPKKQQVYNKFLFDSHLDTLRSVEKIGEQFVKLSVGIRELDDIPDKVEMLHDHVVALEKSGEFAKQTREAAQEASNRQAVAIETLQTQMKNLLPQLNGACNKVLEQEKELVQLRKAASLQGSHIVKLEKKLAAKKK